MGLIYGNVRFGSEDGAIWEGPRTLIDPGATHCRVPAPVAEQLHGRLFQRARVMLADGSVQERDIVYLQVQVDDAPPAVLTTVMVGDKHAPYLLGAIALEQLGLGLDLSSQELIPELSVLLSTFNWRTI